MGLVLLPPCPWLSSLITRRVQFIVSSTLSFTPSTAWQARSLKVLRSILSKVDLPSSIRPYLPRISSLCSLTLSTPSATSRFFFQCSRPGTWISRTRERFTRRGVVLTRRSVCFADCLVSTCYVSLVETFVIGFVVHLFSTVLKSDSNSAITTSTSLRHEVVGVVTEVGSKVQKFKVGDNVGVGCMVGSCNSCDSCSNNLENYCPKMILTYGAKYHDGTTTYGGYSDTMVADEHFVVRIPDNLPLDGGAPLLCAGVTVYSPLRYYGLDKPGMQVGVVGLGGLGHVAVKFAKAMGVKVTVISTSPKKEKEALERLGADSFLVSTDQDQMQAAQGTLDGIIDTVSAEHPLLPLIGLLKSHGKLVMVGAPVKPLELPVFPLIMGRKMVGGSGIGGMKETQEMVDFAAKHNITADIEVIPIHYVNTAMERLSKADVRYRFVIDIGNTLKSSL